MLTIPTGDAVGVLGVSVATPETSGEYRITKADTSREILMSPQKRSRDKFKTGDNVGGRCEGKQGKAKKKGPISRKWKTRMTTGSHPIKRSKNDTVPPSIAGMAIFEKDRKATTSKSKKDVEVESEKEEEMTEKMQRTPLNWRGGMSIRKPKPPSKPVSKRNDRM